jgi:Dullard-like phosphatase family protein
MVRPGVEEFIKKVSKLYEVIIFTASLAKYALPLLDILDRDKNIKYRLTREHCTFLNGIYIKELKKLNRNLKDLIILDNSPLAYAFDSDNGLPIKAWYEDREDKELDRIFPILEFLSKTNDVRLFINKFVNNNEIIFNTANEIIKKFKDNNNKGINKSKDNKEDWERKAISVNININIKNNMNNTKNKLNSNIEKKLWNKIPNKENKNNNINIIRRN